MVSRPASGTDPAPDSDSVISKAMQPEMEKGNGGYQAAASTIRTVPKRELSDAEGAPSDPY